MGKEEEGSHFISIYASYNFIFKMQPFLFLYLNFNFQWNTKLSHLEVLDSCHFINITAFLDPIVHLVLCSGGNKKVAKAIKLKETKQGRPTLSSQVTP